jgi:alpha-1,3-mannosyltransferase
MQQVSLYLFSEHNYALIKGSIGSLVYPAAYVYIYSALYYAMNEGRNTARGQLIFIALYLVALAFVISCYCAIGALLYIFMLLILSKRLHSIFLL